MNSIHTKSIIKPFRLYWILSPPIAFKHLIILKELFRIFLKYKPHYRSIPIEDNIRTRFERELNNQHFVYMCFKFFNYFDYFLFISLVHYSMTYVISSHAEYYVKKCRTSVSFVI